MTRRLYIDEDPAEHLAVLLRSDGHDVVTTRERGHKGRTDPWQLAFAAREQRIFVTCNFKDFEMLHEGWLSWSAEWGVTDRARHPGILVVPNGREILPERLYQLIRDILDREPDLTNRLLRWKETTEWSDLSVAYIVDSP